MQLPPFLTQGSLGEIRVTGHRIDLFHIIYYHNSGQSAAQLHEEFPTLSVELLEEVLAFYENNRAEVDAYVKRCQDEIERQRATGKHLDMAEMLRRWEKLQQGKTG
jgi:uncharacterized protein (DUF433 family)